MVEEEPKWAWQIADWKFEMTHSVLRNEDYHLWVTDDEGDKWCEGTFDQETCFLRIIRFLEKNI